MAFAKPGAPLDADDQGDKKRTLAGERFRQHLLNGTLVAGSTVTQNDLAEMLGVSLTPLRELLVLLEDQGLIEVRHRAGITIIYPDLSFIRENLQFRSMIELSAIESFTISASEDWIREETEQHRALRDELQSKPMQIKNYSTEHFDRPFHLAMVAALGNPTIIRTYERIMDNVTLAQMVHRQQFTRAQITDTIDEHLAILDRVAARDADGAAQALKAHFKLSTHRIIGG
ncbi:GntR family transcriptional regulator [Marinovum sp.]|uniref:GntR family transcriptional regulator n=1 Tax=Marinovum sp. TaxID=2024839 RepID=UPI002B26AD55|nr:GntR family transcriptional regulator [Marinovum sp.]